jgi:putative mRNA 3-end processing factor
MIYYDHGLFITIGGKKLLFDPDKNVPSEDVDYIFVSHPHSDHYAGLWEYPYTRKIMTNFCYDIISDRRRKSTLDSVIFLNGTHKLGDIRVEIYNSAHMFGAIQFKIRYKKKTIGYTGDLCFDHRMGIPKCDVLTDCDILIIDTTFGEANYIFPKRDKLYQNILGWTNNIISKKQTATIYARALGTTQELISLFNMSNIGARVFLHPTSYKMSGICKNYKFDGDFKQKDSRKVTKKDGIIYIQPILSEINDNTAGICSGWMSKDPRVNTFALSNHCSFDQIVKYIETARPKKVHTVFGSPKQMAEYLRNKGWDASSI